MERGVNVAPTSNAGHFVKGAPVICLDEVTETFDVQGAAVLDTENHTSLKIEEEGMVTCQHVFDPLARAFTKSQD